MYATIAPQNDFFIYVPLIQKSEENAKIQSASSVYEKNVLSTTKSSSQVPFSNWTPISLPGHLTIYAHSCGEEL